MSYKLKQDSIPGFSRKVSKAICDGFYSKNDRMDGGNLMKLTESKQINAFLVKALFEKWQEETENLRSPYFDFEHKKVKDALVTFMNILSGHISVGRSALEPLLEQAVAETVLITFAPVAYVEHVIATGGTVSKKYIKTRKGSFKQLESLSNVSVEDFEEEFPVSPKSFVKAFGLSIDDLFEEEVVSFFDSIEEDADDEELSAEVISVVSEVEEVEPSTAVAETLPAPEPEPEFISKPEPEYSAESEPELQTEPIKMIAEDEDEETDTVNARFNSNGKVQTLADKLKQNTRKSLEASLNLNEKIMFTNTLFGGDNEKMSEALADIDEAGNLDEAKVKSYKYGETWDMESDEVAAFLELIESRFS